MNFLQIEKIMDAGQPNRERIVIQVLTACDMRNYCLLIGHRNLDGTASPVKDNMLWFGPGWVAAGDWIQVYTGPGQDNSEEINGGKNKVLNVFWGKDHTILQNIAVVPMLCGFGFVNFPTQPAALPQALLSN